jgi:RNase adaptor protein for sRNA GlmZ degradation
MPVAPDAAPVLTVQVRSFSYKHRLPPDKSKHGGGFMFDCRGILNPGRYEAYKRLSGLDEPVRAFLQNETRMPAFLQHAQGLISITVADYIERGFTDLSVAFGCTGGQHRSVFAAEATAAWLRTTYGVNTEVTHLNRERWIRAESTSG